ncbi:hypothetical protein M413DRAFT_438828 [Hebeloma cylindrosporum]|uniref:TNFR-Cys domain-containing protein n=1 Tax=Hebeloma cylindrosporum TaxID=76867 RepID=A0A0C3CLV1_HEBCY|nr:hypothetical protein M413DRAFT_438828 [Hebeloma cylindrosporum h7]
MKFSIAVITLLTAGFIQSAVGLKCTSGCAACWKDNNNNGLDTKISCNNSDCGDKCPSGYSRMHCAETARCQCYKDPRGYPTADCGLFGPCACGTNSPNENLTKCNNGGCL